MRKLKHALCLVRDQYGPIDLAYEYRKKNTSVYVIFCLILIVSVA